MPGMPHDSAQANETQKQQPLGRASFRENTAHVVALGPFHLSPVGTAGQSLCMKKLLCAKRSAEVSLQKTGTQEVADADLKGTEPLWAAGCNGSGRRPATAASKGQRTGPYLSNIPVKKLLSTCRTEASERFPTEEPASQA